MADYKLNLTGNVIQKKLDVAPYAETKVVEVLPQMSFGADQMTDMGWVLTSPLPKSLEVGKEYIVNWNGKEYTGVVTERPEDGYTMLCLGNASAYIGDGNTGEPFAFIEASPAIDGVYAIIAPADGSTYATISIKAVEETIHKLPSKYVEGGAGGSAGGGASKYKQPEWGAETGIVDILPETAISVGETMEGVIEPRFYVVEGKKYIVNYNGIDYVCTARTVDGILALGNVEFLIDAGDTGEPFVISPFNDKEAEEFGAGGVIYPIDGSTSVTLSIKSEVEIIHTIPTKYTGSTMRVTVSHDKTADKTYEEIETAIENGVIVQVFFDAVGNLSETGYTVYTLSQFIKGAGIFFYNGALRQILTIASDGTIDSGMAD